MTQLRIRLIALTLWLGALHSMERLAGSTGLQTSVAWYATLAAVVFLLVGEQRRWANRWWYAAVTACVPLVRWLAGAPVFGDALPAVFTETSFVFMTLMIVDGILQPLREVRDVIRDAVTIRLGADPAESDAAEVEVRTELKRARRFERPLTVMTISARGHRKDGELNAILLRAQREAIDRFVEGKLYLLLKQQVRDCDLVTRKNGQFVVVMPETDRNFAQSSLERLREIVADEIGLTVSAGIAAFPSEERTLVGLMDRAASEMDSRAYSDFPQE